MQTYLGALNAFHHNARYEMGVPGHAVDRPVASVLPSELGNYVSADIHAARGPVKTLRTRRASGIVRLPTAADSDAGSLR